MLSLHAEARQAQERYRDSRGQGDGGLPVGDRHSRQPAATGDAGSLARDADTASQPRLGAG